jgi:predicted enzyme related to lactoylglutathione lyase
MFEVISADPKRAQGFYGELFDWTFSVDEAMGGYGLTEAGIAGGVGPSMGAGDTGVKVYVRVDDLASYLERAERLGATTLVGPTALPGDYGSFAIFADPDGNAVGLWA